MAKPPDDDRSGFILWALSGFGLWVGIYSIVTVALVTALTIRISTRSPSVFELFLGPAGDVLTIVLWGALVLAFGIILHAPLVLVYLGTLWFAAHHPAKAPWRGTAITLAPLTTGPYAYLLLDNGDYSEPMYLAIALTVLVVPSFFWALRLAMPARARSLPAPPRSAT